MVKKGNYQYGNCLWRDTLERITRRRVCASECVAQDFLTFLIFQITRPKSQLFTCLQVSQSTLSLFHQLANDSAFFADTLQLQKRSFFFLSKSELYFFLLNQWAVCGLCVCSKSCKKIAESVSQLTTDSCFRHSVSFALANNGALCPVLLSHLPWKSYDMMLMKST